ncbi:hypothetical protein A8709_32905 [Paenibacillus pectinilyticus]|uniref:Uncharacterized protein n=1 Tax=Paenibacillus pectinilyticus TaxID=512399 RepID=A0A1C0ZWX4_9BACL|nr:hypothetical protein [Paenibacillus pectinilyticus]OCT12612.1 hypothetical protein A8709_32905 [Paenibacillus pectinilyticus]
MNAIERRNKRVRRFSILKQIESLEKSNCEVCPNRTSTDSTCCKVCPVPDMLSELGDELIKISERTYVVSIKEGGSSKYKQKMKSETHYSRGKQRRVNAPRNSFTKDEYIAGIAMYGKASVFARSMGLNENTVRHKANSWGVNGIKQEQAQEMMRMKEGTA